MMPSKFDTLQKSLFSLFGAAGWASENIKTFPENYVDPTPGNEFIRVAVISGEEGINLTSSAGIILIDIFTPSGEGVLRRGQIADKLDQYLVGKTVQLNGGALQLFKSSMVSMGVDRDNASLFRSNYSIPFQFFGV
jgi:hypothetical protein